MPEHQEKLHGVLKELESELDSVGSLDEQSRAAVMSALEDIVSALRQKDFHALQKNETITDRLRDAADEFEHSHPTLFGIVSRTIDALGQMGI